MHIILENIQTYGAVVASVWAVTIVCVLLWPQRCANSLLLMLSLFVTMLFVSGFFDHGARGYFLPACFPRPRRRPPCPPIQQVSSE